MHNKSKTLKKLFAILLFQIILLVIGIIFNTNTIKATTDTETKYYISNEQELKTFAEAVNNGNTYEGVTVYLTKDIALSCSATNQWVPIGSCNVDNGNLAQSTTDKKVFAGIFDGNGYTISGVYIDSNENYVGLFGYNKGTIQNLKLKDSTIKSSKSYVGGIVAYNTGKILNCHNYANVVSNSSKGVSGGISAYSINANLIDCSNKGKMEGTNGFIAGITGYAKETKIENCYNAGEVKTSAYAAAGVCGLSQNSWLYNCYNKGEVTAINYVGGVVAETLEYSSILNCYNIGRVQNVIKDANLVDEAYVGGLVAYSGLEDQSNSKIVNCYNVGELTVNNPSNKLTTYKGNVSAKHDLGTINNCYYEKGTTGAIGKNNNEAKTTNLVELEKDKIKDKETVTKLNNGEQVYYYDDQVINNGYPILDNQHRVLLQPNGVDSKVVVKDSVRYLKDITPPISLAKALTDVETEANINVNNAKIETIDINDKIKTGIKLTTYLNDEKIEYVVVVTGDLLGDGEMDDADLLKLARYKVGLDTKLEGAFLMATDITRDNDFPKDIDLLKMVRILVGLEKF